MSQNVQRASQCIADNLGKRRVTERALQCVGDNLGGETRHSGDDLGKETCCRGAHW